ncbi:MAG TPA: DUF4019 domain-containing protein, partial [Pyrinomonadaceae bacterium]|nr:DUF4019 domain-containing protein [Pyrinomonadaceae bacterium]
STAWLDLWGKMKCRESYGGLSPISREGVDEKQWVDYCTTANNALGKNMSRKLIAVAFTRSLPPKTDRPVGVIAYHSNFANRASVVELMGLIFEKDGSWLVTNYLTP